METVNMLAKRIGHDYHLFADSTLLGKLVDCEFGRFVFQAEDDRVQEAFDEIESPDLSVASQLPAVREAFLVVLAYDNKQSEAEYRAEVLSEKAWLIAAERNPEHVAEMDFEDMNGYT